MGEKRSGRPSILRKFKKMVISKSLHKRKWSTRKLAGKLTFKGPQCSKDTVCRYLKFNLGANSCKRPVFRKIPKNQMANDFSFPRRDRIGQFEDLMRITRWMSNVPVSLELAKMTAFGPKTGQKVEPTQKSKFAPKIIFWIAMTASGVSKVHVLPPNRTVRAKYNQESILSLFLPDDMIWPVILEKLQKEDFMKTCWIWHCYRTEHQLTRPQKLKVGSETIFLNSKSKLMTPNMPDLSPIENLCWFSKPGLKCQNLTPGILNICRPLWKAASND